MNPENYHHRFNLFLLILNFKLNLEEALESHRRGNPSEIGPLAVIYTSLVAFEIKAHPFFEVLCLIPQ